ncbi:MAG: bifunctional adenosylcobinamide kinase/adenosylcobinamide-phosphate guanylyltransferase [Pseudomonadota bacterium]
MTRLHLILGGARSGKSARAQSLAEAARPQRVFIATAEARDTEMAERIARHQADRGAGWETAEAPIGLAGAISAYGSQDKACLVDCLTLWLSNIMHADHDIEKRTEELCASLKQAQCPVFLVSNELGLGLVPETPLGRRFRDAQGRLNQAVAAACDKVEFVVAGLTFTMKE